MSTTAAHAHSRNSKLMFTLSSTTSNTLPLKNRKFHSNDRPQLKTVMAYSANKILMSHNRTKTEPQGYKMLEETGVWMVSRADGGNT